MRMLMQGTCLTLSLRACAHPAQSYDSAKQLRYGHLMIMTDQDHDGCHIKGLIMNFLHHFYPCLLRVAGLPARVHHAHRQGARATLAMSIPVHLVTAFPPAQLVHAHLH